MACPNGHPQPEMQTSSETITTKNKPEEKVTMGTEINPLAVHHHICKRCGYDKAELIDIQPFYSDEDSVYRMKCGKCGLVEQLEGKIT